MKGNSFLKKTTLNLVGNFRNFCCPEILIVDDTDLNRIAVRQILKTRFKLFSDEACNGLECIDMLKERTLSECSCPFYKILFLDLEMPLLNGKETAKKIMKMKGKGQIPNELIIVAYTAYTDEEENCKALGMDYFSKCQFLIN